MSSNSLKRDEEVELLKDRLYFYSNICFMSMLIFLTGLVALSMMIINEHYVSAMVMLLVEVLIVVMYFGVDAEAKSCRKKLLKG